MGALTPNQAEAVALRGNVLVMAGAGTGKTRTLVERCVARLLAQEEPVSMDRVLMVTFTKAAAAEMRRRIRERLLEEGRRQPANDWLADQVALVDSARISTLHSFCHALVSEHSQELGLDPQVMVLDATQGALLAIETLDRLLARHYSSRAPESEAVRQLILAYGSGRDQAVRGLVRRLHAYARTRSDPGAWFAQQAEPLESDQPVRWGEWLVEAFTVFRGLWLPRLKAQDHEFLQGCAAALEQVGAPIARDAIVRCLEAVAPLAEAVWPRGSAQRFRNPNRACFAEAGFLLSLARQTAEVDPLVEDWQWVRPHLRALLGLTREFAAEFGEAKRQLAAVDFHDLEQFALELLWDRRGDRPTPIAEGWRQRLQWVFVDEYQDINAAQDQILRALSRADDAGNRFLVGDVKQSIYRFRLADPRIFQDYTTAWSARPERGRVVTLQDNFRSHEAILEFVNTVFARLMRADVGGVEYDERARLELGDRPARGHRALAGDTLAGAGPTSAGRPRDPGGANAAAPPIELAAEADTPPRVELHLRLTGRAGVGDGAEEGEDAAELEDPGLGSNTEREALLIGLRLRELSEQGFGVWDDRLGGERPVRWSDMAILLRSPRNKAEAYAKVFHRLGLPLSARRGGLYEATEVTDLLSLLMLLDNPLQDVPALAVLRSPLGRFTLDELAAVRLHRRKGNFWTALRAFHREYHGPVAGEGQGAEIAGELAAARAAAWAKAGAFLGQFDRWRALARHGALSDCLETVLDETRYEDELLAQERGVQRRANVLRLLRLTRQFDPFQRQGLFRFLRFVEAQQEVEPESEPSELGEGDAVRLMSIHQSKGLEFPVVAVADLGKRFNRDEVRGDLILDEVYGVCARVRPPTLWQSYPSLAYWLASQRQVRESMGEELRLLYVAATRAADKLILAGTTSRNRVESRWQLADAGPMAWSELLAAGSALDWLGPLMPGLTGRSDWHTEPTGRGPFLGWRLYEPEEPTALPPCMPASVTPTVAAAVAPREEQPSAPEWIYPHTAATIEPAKSSVSSLRRRVLEETDAEARPLFREALAPVRSALGLTATERGTAHHRFLQLLDMAQAGAVEGLVCEAARLRAAGRLRAEEEACLDFEALATFWQSELGRRIRGEPAGVERELEFTARFAPGELKGLGIPVAQGVGDDEYVVVQGVIDLAAIEPGAIWLLDFKTDDVTATEANAKAEGYRPQLGLYAAALERIYGRPVTEAWLYFLACHRAVRVSVGR